MTTHDQSPDEFADLIELMRDERDPFGRGAEVDLKVSRARRRRAGIAVALVLVLMFATVGGYVAWALHAPLGAPVVTSQEAPVESPVAASISLPSEGASVISIAGADQYLGAEASGIWATTGTDEPRPIGSITKLVTALVVLEAMPLASADDPGPTIAFDKADRDLYDKYYVLGATIASMPTGTTMSQRDALATMLIPSASNYAEAVSNWAFGSSAGFQSAAQAWLTANGLGGTTIVEPTGIDAGNTSTPSDLIALAKIAAADPVVADIAATPSLSLPGPGTMDNTNELLGGEYTGLKTGNLGEGTHNLLYTANVEVGAAEPLRVTGVVLGGFSRQTVNQSVVTLIESIRSGFHGVEVASLGQEVGTFTTPWGSTARMIVGETASIFTWSDTPIESTMQLTTPETYGDGEVVGSITFTAGPNSATAPIVIEGDIEPPTGWWRVTHPSELGAQ